MNIKNKFKKAIFGGLAALVIGNAIAKPIEAYCPGYLPSDVPAYAQNSALPRCIPKPPNDCGQPPQQCKAATAWGFGIYDTRQQGDGKVYLDYLKLYARKNGVDNLIASEEFTDTIPGALFSKWNWKYLDNIPATLENGYAILNFHEHPDKIWHWWGFPIADLPKNTERVWMKTRIKTEGAVIIWPGFDYWRASQYVNPDVDLREGAMGCWQQGTSNGWKILTACYEAAVEEKYKSKNEKFKVQPSLGKSFNINGVKEFSLHDITGKKIDNYENVNNPHYFKVPSGIYFIRSNKGNAKITNIK